MKQTKLAKAISYALAGVALTAGSVTTASAQVTTMYNLTSSGGTDVTDTIETMELYAGTADPKELSYWYMSGDTDGWNYGKGTASNEPGATVVRWAGTADEHSTPFGYTPPHLHWAVDITGGNGGTGEISTYDAFNRYGIYADIDTAQGAWSDNKSGTTNPGAAGWRHDLDFGLFKSDASGTVNLSVEGIIQSGTNFGFTIFKGMDTINTTYNHHGAWNEFNNVDGLSDASFPYDKAKQANPWTIDDIVAYSVGGDTPERLNAISFDAEAGQIYTIVLGGYREGLWGDTTDGYRLSISQEVSQVPLPGAVWLFGSALAGFVGIQRRKQIKA